MFYRVDYALAVLLAGFLAGVIFSKRTANIPSSQLAKACYATIATLLILRTLAFTFAMLGVQRGFWSKAGGLTGDLTAFVLAALFGLAVRRMRSRELLTDPLTLAALCLSLAFTFVLVAVGKAFSMVPMTEFFTQSGYSVSFLKFIVIAEVFGGIGLLLPWAVVPAVTGLSIDMFGAVLTHLHNGDPLNDSTDAISMLIRLAALSVLWTMRPHAGYPVRSARSSILRVGMAAILCLAIALCGSIAMRHSNGPTVSAGSVASH